MKKLLLGLFFLIGVSPLAMAQSQAKGADMKAVQAKKEPSAKQKAQQERMKSCSKQATGKKGDERKKFMSACLKG